MNLGNMALESTQSCSGISLLFMHDENTDIGFQSCITSTSPVEVPSL